MTQRQRAVQAAVGASLRMRPRKSNKAGAWPRRLMAIAFCTIIGAVALAAPPAERPRARDVGLAVGTYPPGRWNAITDVPGVRVGQTTIRRGNDVRTGVTVIFPHEDNPFFSRVPAAIAVGNGFGKLAGSTQVAELGELETPIALTCTLCTWRVAESLAKWMLASAGHGRGPIHQSGRGRNQ